MIPFTAVQLLWINLVMDAFASLALATENPSEITSKDLPNQLDEFIITSEMFKHIIFQSIMQLIVLLVMIYDGE